MQYSRILRLLISLETCIYFVYGIIIHSESSPERSDNTEVQYIDTKIYHKKNTATSSKKGGKSKSLKTNPVSNFLTSVYPSPSSLPSTAIQQPQTYIYNPVLTPSLRTTHRSVTRRSNQPSFIPHSPEAPTKTTPYPVPSLIHQNSPTNTPTSLKAATPLPSANATKLQTSLVASSVPKTTPTNVPTTLLTATLATRNPGTSQGTSIGLSSEVRQCKFIFDKCAHNN